MLSVIFKTN